MLCLTDCRSTTACVPQCPFNYILL